jgi:hypothetical protein
MSGQELLALRSHRRRYSVPTDPPRATLRRSIRLLDRDDKDFRADLDGYELDCRRPRSQSIVDVSYFAQTPVGQRRKPITIETPVASENPIR